MQPADPGRGHVYTRYGDIIESDGVFFYQKYVTTPLSVEGFQAYAENDDQTDFFSPRGWHPLSQCHRRIW